MGLKVLTLALCSVTGRKVRVNSTGEKAKVLVHWEGGRPVYRLSFDDGRVENVVWSQDMQGHTIKGEELIEADDGNGDPNDLISLVT